MVHAPDCTEYMRGVGRNRCGGNGLARVMDRASVAVTPIQADIRASPVPLSDDDGPVDLRLRDCCTQRLQAVPANVNRCLTTAPRWHVVACPLIAIDP
jgi:hypothetical protein